MVIRANGIDSRRLYHYLTSEGVITKLQTEAESRSGTFPQIRFENIQQMDILIATPDIEGEFSNLLHDTYKTIDSNNAESTCLAAIRDALLPRLMSREIELEND
jgi:type I restriction enzyme S subunit